MKKEYERIVFECHEIDFESSLFSGSQQSTIILTEDGISVEPFTDNEFPEITF